MRLFRKKKELARFEVAEVAPLGSSGWYFWGTKVVLGSWRGTGGSVPTQGVMGTQAQSGT